ncbi:MAG: hypothetical protein JWO45_748, partial [Spartobacteria bacterium]|nr:hypothetical protein [Spartobacteria bacterium]
GFLEEFCAERLSMPAEGDELMAGQDGAKAAFALKQREAAQIISIMEHEVERAILKFRFVSERVLQQLEVRNAMRIQGDKLAVNHGVTFHTFERPGDFNIAVTDDLAVTAVEGDPAAFDFGDHAKPVILVLEYPSRIIERRVRERRKHRLQAFG